jgi:hypothetical protein
MAVKRLVVLASVLGLAVPLGYSASAGADGPTTTLVTRNPNDDPASDYGLCYAGPGLLSITQDAEYVAFGSSASDLLGGEAGGQPSQVYRADVSGAGAGTISAVSGPGLYSEYLYGSSGTPAISDDGTVVAFASGAMMVEGVMPPTGGENYVVDLTDPDFEWASDIDDVAHGFTSAPSISGDGDLVAFEWWDGENQSGVYLYDVSANEPERLTDGNRPMLSRNGDYVAYVSTDGDVVRMDTSNHDSETVSVAGDDSIDNVAISGNGDIVAFSRSSYVAPPNYYDPPEVYARDMSETNSEPELVSAPQSGSPQGGSVVTSVSPSGRYIAFDSSATNLVSDDTNGYVDVFVRDMTESHPRLVSRDDNGDQGNADSCAGSISGTSNGLWVSFGSNATNFASGISGDAPLNVFVRGPLGF